MFFAKLFVTSEWLLTLGFVGFFGFTVSQVIGQAYQFVMHASLWTLLDTPTLDTLMKMLG